MSKLRSKGTTLSLDIDSVMTPITQMTSIGFDGAEAETFDGRTLDQTPAWIPYPTTGYSEPGSCSFEGFYDPQLAPHQAVTECLATPDDYDWQVDYVDTTAQTFTGGGVSVGITADPSDGLRWSGGIKISGDPGFYDSAS